MVLVLVLVFLLLLCMPINSNITSGLLAVEPGMLTLGPSGTFSLRCCTEDTECCTENTKSCTEDTESYRPLNSAEKPAIPKLIFPRGVKQSITVHVSLVPSFLHSAVTTVLS